MKRSILYIFVYILITAVAAFGTVMISALLPSTGSFGSTSGGDLVDNVIAEPTAGEKVLNNFMSMGTSEINLELELIDTNIEARTISANENANLSSTQIKFNGNINISDLQNIQVEGDLSLVMQGNPVNLSISYINNTLYISNETLNIKMEAVSLSKIMDVLPTLGINMNLDIDMSSLDINQITSNFSTMPETTLENGDKALTLNLMEGISVDFITDQNYNVKGIKANKLELSNYVVNVSAGLQQVDAVIESPEEKTEVEYVDVTKTLNIMDSVKEIMTNEKLHLNLNANVQNMDVSIIGDVDVDFGNRVNAYADLDVNIQGTMHKLKIGFISEDIYITFNNLNFIVTEDTMYDVFRVMGEREGISQIEQEIIIAIAKTMPGLNISQILQGDFSSVNINNLLEFSSGEDNVINVTVYGDALKTKNDIEVIIKLDSNDQFKELTINGLELMDDKVSVDVSYSNIVTIPNLNSQDYYDLADLPNFINALLATYDYINLNKECDFNVDSTIYVKGVPVKVNGQFTVEFKNDVVVVYLNLNVNVFNKTFNINMLYGNEYIYLQVDNLKFSCTVNDIDSVIQIVKNNLNNDQLAYALEVANQAVEMGNLIAEIASGNLSVIPQDVITSLTMESGVLSVGIIKELFGLNNDVVLNVGYSNNITEVEVVLKDFNTNVKLNLTNDITIPTINVNSYSALTHLDALVKAILNSVNQFKASNTLGVNVQANINYNNISLPVNGFVAITNNVKYVTLSTTYNSKNINVELYYLNNQICVNIDGLKIKTNIDGLNNLIKLFNADVNAQMLNLSQTISQIDVATIDLSGLNLSVINNIKIQNNVANVVLSGNYLGLSDNLNANLYYNNSITGVEITNLVSQNINANVVCNIVDTFEVPVVNVNDYSDITNVDSLVNAVNSTVEHLTTNKNMALTINSKIADNYTVKGTIYVNYANVVDITTDYNNLEVYASLNLVGNYTYNLTLRVNKGYAYVEFNGLNIKSKIDSVIDVANIIKGILPSDVTNNLQLDVNRVPVIADVVNGNYSNLYLGLIKQITMSKNSTTIVLDKSLINADNNFSLFMAYTNMINTISVPYLNVNGKEYSLNVRADYAFVAPKLHSNRYYDVSDLPNLLNAIINTANNINQNKQINLLVDASVIIENIPVKLNGEISVDYNSDVTVYANLYANVFNKTFNINVLYLSDQVYLAVDNLKFTSSVQNLQDIINLLSSKFNVAEAQIVTDITNSVASVGNIFAEVINGNLNALPSNLINGFVMGNGALNVQICKELFAFNNNVSLNVEYGEYLNNINVSIPDYNLQVKVDVVNNVQIPNINISEYTSLQYANNLINAVFNTVENVNNNQKVMLNLSANVAYNNTSLQITGATVIAKNNIYITLNTTYNNRLITVEAYIIDNNNVYVNVDNLKLKTTLTGLNNLSKLFGTDVEAVIVDLVNEASKVTVHTLNLSTLNLNVIQNINILENSASVTLLGSELSLDNNLTITVTYAESVLSVSTSNIVIDNITASVNATLLNNYTVPTLVIADYSNVENLYSLVSAITNTIDYLNKNQKIALNVKASLNNYSVNGLVYIDYANVTNIAEDYNALTAYASISLTANYTYNLVVRLESGYLYVEYNGLNVKSKINSIVDVVNIINGLLPEDAKTNLVQELQVFNTSVINDVINKNYNTITLALIKNIVMTQNSTSVLFDKSLVNATADFSVNVTYTDKISSVSIPTISVGSYQANVLLNTNYQFVLPELNVNKYFDVSGIANLTNSVLNTIETISNNKYIAINISNINLIIDGIVTNFNGDVYVNFANAIETTSTGETTFNYKNLVVYASLQAKTKPSITAEYNSYVHNITLYYMDQYLYLTYNTLSVCVATDTLTSVIDLINQIKALEDKIKGTTSKQVEVNTNIDIVEVLQKLLPNVNFDEIINGNINAINMQMFKHLSITENSFNLMLNKDALGTFANIELSANYTDNVSSITFDGLAYKNVNVYGGIGVAYSYEMPSINYNSYTNLDNLTSAMSSVLTTAEDVVDSKNIAFNLDTELIHTSYEKDAGGVIQKEIITAVKLLDGSYAKFDWSNAYEQTEEGNKFNLQKMSIYAKFVAKVDTSTCYYASGAKDESTLAIVSNTHNIEITYLNNVVYITFDQMKAYISGDTIGGVIDIVSQMLGLEVSTNSFDNLMNIISTSTDSSMLSKVKVEMLRSIYVSNSLFSAVVDLGPLELGLEEFNILDLDVEYSNLGLQNLVVKNLKLSNISVDAVNIGLLEFTPIESVDTTGYINLAGVENLLDAVNNTIKFTDYEIDGNVKLQLNILNINFDVKVNGKLKVTDNGLEGKLVLGPVPVITGVNDDAPYIAGNSVDGINPGEDRVLTVYLKDNFVYLYRTERVPAFLVKDRIYEKRTKVHIDTFMSDPLYYLLEYGLGFSSDIMKLIYDAVYKERINPLDYSNILTGYSNSGNKYDLSLNMEELLEDPKVQKLDVDVTTTMYNGNNVVDILGVDLFMPVADGVEITLFSDNLTFINRDVVIDFSNDLYPYVEMYKTDKEGAEWDAYNGDWGLAAQRKFTVEFVTNCDQTVATYEGIAGSRFNLPVLQNYYVDSAKYRTYYEFAGWYDTITFDNEYTDPTMPRRSMKLYAKWNTSQDKYITIGFVENGGSEQDALTVLEGSILQLPQYFDLLTIEYTDKIETLQFEGWYVDAELTTAYVSEFAPSSNITLYAKWTLVDMLQTYAVNLYDNGEKIATRRFFEGSNITFNGLSKINNTTKYYSDANLTTEITNMVMPSNDINIHIANEYTVTIISNYGKVINMSYKAYQGTAITVIPTQEQTYSYDADIDNDGKAESVKHTFNGYKINGVIGTISVVPNSDVQIVADWTVEHLEYFLVKFHVDWVKPGSWQDNNSKLFGKIERVRGATAPQSFEVLEGSTINPSLYNATCRYKYTGGYVGKEYEFDVATWSTSGCGQLYYNNGVFKNDDYTKLTKLVIEDNTDLYAVWKYVG